MSWAAAGKARINMLGAMARSTRCSAVIVKRRVISTRRSRGRVYFRAIAER
jgi:hypothetical protein